MSVPHSSHWTWRRGHVVAGNLLSIVTPSVFKQLQSHRWYQIRDINWPAGIDIQVFNPFVTHGLCLVPMGCREWRLVLSVNLVLHAATAQLWRHNNLIFAHLLTMMLVSTTSHCSKRDVTMISGSLVTLHTRVLIRTAAPCDENLIFLQRHSVNNTTVILLTGDTSPDTWCN